MLGAQTGEQWLEPMAAPFHTAEVIAVSSCQRKPLGASISTDRTLRLWNFHDRLSSDPIMHLKNLYLQALEQHPY